MTDQKIEYIIQCLDRIEEKLQGYVEINAKLTYELILLKGGGTTSSSTSTTESYSLNSKPKSDLSLNVIDEIICITGKKTYDLRHIFKSNGGMWSKENSRWEVSIDNKDDLLKELDETNIKYDFNENKK